MELAHTGRDSNGVVAANSWTIDGKDISYWIWQAKIYPGFGMDMLQEFTWRLFSHITILVN
jgi:hypothetical protein